jgi:hypothetical protein
MPAAVIDRIARDRFWPLPQPSRADGAPRRCGVEIECAGLSLREAADLLRALWGGRLDVERAKDRLALRGGRYGTLRIERDTALSRAGAEGALRAALGDLVPVEIVTDPLAPGDLPLLDRTVAALRAAGARGSRDGVAFGFGVHLNPEVAAETADFVVPVVRAFALLEDWLRASDPIDPARRLLPFVDPWPRRLVDALAADGAAWDLPALTERYLALSPSRNRGLDLLPLLTHLDPDRVAAALPEAKARGGRPAFHYRLPEARLDEAGWTLAYEWNRWVLVERVAAQPDLLAALAADWQEHRAALTTLRGDWAPRVEAMLAAAEIWA